LGFGVWGLVVTEACGVCDSGFGFLVSQP